MVETVLPFRFGEQEEFLIVGPIQPSVQGNSDTSSQHRRVGRSDLQYGDRRRIGYRRECNFRLDVDGPFYTLDRLRTTGVIPRVC